MTITESATINDLMSAIDEARRQITMAETALIYARIEGPDRVAKAKNRLRQAANHLIEWSEK